MVTINSTPSSPALHMAISPLSSLERGLTKHIRYQLEKYSSKTLKKFAFLISLSSCLCAGSVLLFPLFTPVFSHDLHFTQIQINIIGSFTSMGMYFLLPVLGYLADSHGPVVLSVISLLLFSPGYIIAALAVKNEWNFWIFAVTFALIGCATSALYFSCLLTCAKIFPESKGLTISAPVTAYGLSSLIGSQALKLRALRNQSGELDLFKTFKIFAVLYFALGLFNWVSSTVVTIERDLLANKPLEPTEADQLLQSDEEASTHPHYNSSETIELEINDLDHRTKYINFLKDGSAYILLFSILLSIGPSEMYITNMGSLIQAISPNSEVSDQVSIHAVFSTLSRLSLGALSDILLSKYGISRIVLLLMITVIGGLTQFFIAANILVEHHYYIISALAGFSYGGLFTLVPTVVLSIWGSEIFGSTWGTFLVAPAIGSTEFGILYALIYDAKCSIDLSTAGSYIGYNCISSMFWIITFGFFASLVLLLTAWRFLWIHRKNSEL